MFNYLVNSRFTVETSLIRISNTQCPSTNKRINKNQAHEMNPNLVLYVTKNVFHNYSLFRLLR